MRFFFLFFIIFLFSSVVLAIGFSPSSLTFNLNKGQEECKDITVSSESPTITVSDKWAENKDVAWNVNLFDETANVHGINLDYPNKINSDDNVVKVCLSGEDEGEYHGVILLQEEQTGNSIIQMAVWIKAIISNNGGSSNNQNLGNSGSGGGSSIKNIEDNSEVEEDIIEEQDQSEKITTKAVQDIPEDSASENENLEIVPKERNYLLWGIITILGLFILSILIIRTINIRKRRNKNGL